MTAPLHQKEEARLHELYSLRVLDSDPEAEFDNLVAIARDVFDVPIAYVSLVAEHRQWLKSKIGVDVCETSRDIALCAHAILESEPLVINDTTLDDRFIDNPLVTGDLHVRFYAGAQVLVNGLPIGTFCCVDTEPRHFTDEQTRALKGFAQQAATLLDWRLSAKRLAESELRLASFLDNAPMHAYLKDKEGRMRYANKFFRDMIGKTNEEMIGLTSDNWFPPKVAAQARMSDLSVLASQQSIDFEASFTTLYGKETAMRGSKFPLEVDGEQMVAGVAIDVTALREAEANLNVQNMLLKERTNELSDALAFAKQLEATSRIAAARFEHLFSGLPVACFSYDVKGVIQEWNAAAERVTGIPAHEAILKPVLGTAVCEVNAAEFREVALRVLAGEIVPNIERREIMKDGSVKWLLSSNIPLTNGAGVVIGGLSASIDVTERKLVEAALEKSEARFRTAIHSMHEGLIVQNCNGDILLCNESSAQILGLSLDQLHGLNSRDPRWRAVRHDSTPWEPEEHPSMVALRTGIEQKDQTMGIHMPSGELSWILLNAVPLFLEGCPEPYAVVVTFRDISERHRFEAMIAQQLGQIQQYAGELEEANVKLQSLASTDGLTGLSNHRTFREQLDSQIAFSRRRNLPFSMILLDVDKFKSFNDDFGHQAGDAVLKGLAKVLQKVSREGELVARYGGEEFVVLLPGATIAEATAAAERFRRSVKAAEWPNRNVTASFGVSTLTPSMDADDIVRTADEALYVSKSNGRDCVTHYSGVGKGTSAEATV